MRIWLAGSANETFLVTQYPYVLNSWIDHVGRSQIRLVVAAGNAEKMATLVPYMPQECNGNMNPAFSFFLDSGAFSAWSKGAAVDIDEYCAFVKANIDHIEVYANLDVIPGQPGRIATIAEREEAAARGWENYLYMRREGLNPIPVFHVGEDWKWLDLMCRETDYIGFGGMVGGQMTTQARRVWLDAAFARICDADGLPRVKVHGFGMTAVSLIFMYPWYSVDSTSWLMLAANGEIYLPAYEDGKFVFDRPPMSVPVSVPKQISVKSGSHKFSPKMRELLDKWLEMCGRTYAQIQEHYYHRAVVNVRFFQEVSAAKFERRFDVKRPRKQSLIS